MKLVTNGTGGADTSTRPELSTAADTSTMVTLDRLWEKTRALEMALAARSDGPPSSNTRLDAVSKAVGGLADGLDRLVGDVHRLQELPARVGALQDRIDQELPARSGFDQRLLDTVERLAGRVNDLEKVHDRVGALERRFTSVADESERRKIGQRLDGLAAKVAVVDKMGSRVTALEQAKRTSTDRDLATLAGRVTQLERAEADRDTPGDLPRLLATLEQTTARVEALEQAPKPALGQAERLVSMEKALGGLVECLERVTSDVAALTEVQKRVTALEESGPPLDKVLTSISKRLDRLSTQVSFYKDVAARLEATEQSAARVDSLTQGLRRAVESIDHLSAQVKGLEPPASASAPTDVAAPAPAAEVSQATPQLSPADALEPQPSEDSTTQ